MWTVCGFVSTFVTLGWSRSSCSYSSLPESPRIGLFVLQQCACGMDTLPGRVRGREGRGQQIGNKRSFPLFFIFIFTLWNIELWQFTPPDTFLILLQWTHVTFWKKQISALQHPPLPLTWIIITAIKMLPRAKIETFFCDAFGFSRSPSQ